MRIALLALVVAVAGCRKEAPAPAAEPAAPKPEPTLVGGRLTLENGAIRLDPCGDPPPRTLVDATNGDFEQATAALRGDIGTPLYVEVMVREGNPAELVAVRRVAPVEIDGCSERWDEIQVRARGNEPFWAVDVAGTTLRYASPEGEFDVPAQQTGPLSWKGASDDHALELTLTETRCGDGMSGEVLPYTARAVRDGTTLEGCANARPDGTQRAPTPR